jgi:hypothetical protein
LAGLAQRARARFLAGRTALAAAARGFRAATDFAPARRDATVIFSIHDEKPGEAQSTR